MVIRLSGCTARIRNAVSGLVPCFRFIILIPLFVLPASVVSAAPSSSTSYTITHDVMSGGGGSSSSTSYTAHTAAGQPSTIGAAASPSFAVDGGFHAIQNARPTITGVWPGTGTIGEVISVFVFGSGFNTTPGATEVYFNGVRQFIVQVVTEDMLIVRVLVDPGLFGPVTVKTSSGTAVSTTSFGTPTTGLQITGVWPGTITTGVPASVFVFGSEFDMTPGLTEVYLNGIRQFIVQVVTPDMLIVRVGAPTTALSGPVTVTTPSGSVTSSTDLVVLP